MFLERERERERQSLIFNKINLENKKKKMMNGSLYMMIKENK